MLSSTFQRLILYRGSIFSQCSRSLFSKQCYGMDYPVDEVPLALHPSNVRNENGSIEETLDRYRIREICEGWPVYRDAAEWKNFRGMFHDDAQIETSWSQKSVDEFIQDSKEAFKKQSKGGMYIFHRITGQRCDLQGKRGASKILIRTKRQSKGWGVCFFTVLFDKDKMIPVDSNRVPKIAHEDVMKYPSGYRYLCWLEHLHGYQPKLTLNSHGPERNILYGNYQQWLEGKNIQLPLTE